MVEIDGHENDGDENCGDENDGDEIDVDEKDGHGNDARDLRLEVTGTSLPQFVLVCVASHGVEMSNQ